MWASSNGHTEVVQSLLDAGADMSAKNQVLCLWWPGGGTGLVGIILLGPSSSCAG